jgi:hypothetical protein
VHIERLTTPWWSQRFELVVGAIILAAYTRLGGYIAAVRLICMAFHLVSSGHDTVTA